MTESKTPDDDLQSVDISCPHCRREYPVRLDLDKLRRVRTQATCTRCKMTFDLLSRVVATTSGSDAETSATKKKTGRRKWKIEERTSETASMSMATAKKRRAEQKGSIEERVSLRADDSRVSSSPAKMGKAEAEAKPRREEQETVKISISELLTGSAIAEEVAKPVGTVTISPSKAAGRPATFELAPVDRSRSKPARTPEPSQTPTTTDWLEVADPGLADLVSTPTSGVLALEELLASG